MSRKTKYHIGPESRGNYNHPLYNTWALMHNRCENKDACDYEYYGGRGISVCERWTGENGFQNFIDDMGDRPDGFTLDRINNDLNYSPENCRWADVTTQRFNRRLFKNNTSGVTGVSYHKGKSKWCSMISVNKKTIHLGTFADIEQAIDARKSAEEKYYGEKNVRS